MVFWEEDNIFDDYVVETRPHCAKKSILNNHVITDHGWDGSLHYEFYVFVTHNCTENGKEVTYRHNFSAVPALEFVYVRYQLNITDKS
ncbi:unnamed protein product [Caenorhabditis angaria]|uniref:Uncharacterized protein n=1 Tax=Caenorhabditis angaria TaxID=860376 RepID=A0A9P1I8F0_9PELO|nr:unnamed protein product [Caenorhabditis angaria]